MPSDWIHSIYDSLASLVAHILTFSLDPPITLSTSYVPSAVTATTVMFKALSTALDMFSNDGNSYSAYLALYLFHF